MGPGYNRLIRTIDQRDLAAAALPGFTVDPPAPQTHTHLLLMDVIYLSTCHDMSISEPDSFFLLALSLLHQPLKKKADKGRMEPKGGK